MWTTRRTTTRTPLRITTGLAAVLLLTVLVAPLTADDGGRVEEITLTLTAEQVECVCNSLACKVELPLTSEQLEIITRIAPRFEGESILLGIDHLRRGDRVLLKVTIPDDPVNEIRIEALPAP